VAKALAAPDHVWKTRTVQVQMAMNIWCPNVRQPWTTIIAPRKLLCAEPSPDGVEDGSGVHGPAHRFNL
jgi:hypothetical protein